MGQQEKNTTAAHRTQVPIKSYYSNKNLCNNNNTTDDTVQNETKRMQLYDGILSIGICFFLANNKRCHSVIFYHVDVVFS